MTIYPEPGLPHIRIKRSPTWGEPTAPAWVSYTVLGEVGSQYLQIEESRLCLVRFKTDLDQPSPSPKKRKIRRIPLKEADVNKLALLLSEAQLPLAGVARGDGYCDADRVELSISQFGLASIYSWDGEPPEAWEALGKIVDFVDGLADEVDQS